MARAKWCSDAVYDLGTAFKEECLIRDGSLFATGEELWTFARVDEVGETIGVGHPVQGSFVDKLVAQLDGLDREGVRLGTEMLCVLLVPELDTSAERKAEHLSRLLPARDWPDGVNAALQGGGVANFAAGKSHRDAYLRFQARLFKRIKQLSADDRRALLTSPWDFHALVGEVRTSTDAMYANALLHLLFPEEFEYMVSETHRQQLIDTFITAPGVADAVAENADRAIARIRELASQGGDSDFDLYEDPFWRIWKYEAPPRWTETITWTQRFYDHDDFDENERIYKLRIADRLTEARDAFLAGHDDWLEKLKRAFGHSKNNLTSWQAHDRFLGWCRENAAGAAAALDVLWREADDTSLHRFLDLLPPEAVKGQGTRVSMASFLMLALDPTRFPFYKPTAHTSFQALLALPRTGPIEIDPEGVYRPEDLAARLGIDGRRVRAWLRDRYPRDETGHSTPWYLTPDQAQAVLEQFEQEADPEAGEALYADWRALLEELRLRMLVAGTPIRDTLDSQGLVWLLVKWTPDDWDASTRAALEVFRGGQSAVVEPEVETPAAVDETTPSVSLPAATAALEKELHVPQSWLQELIDVLTEARQLILYGPPGTGKTYIAQAIGRQITGAGGVTRLVQFHPSYTYEDFFEGYRPEHQSGGSLSFDLVPGVLRELSAAATGAPGVPHLLIVDEINRGNIAKIFGELYFLLEYRSAAIRLQYSRDEEFRLPTNLFVIGTMNTADRSIALVDSALRRRFSFVELNPRLEPVKHVLRTWLLERGQPPEAADLLDELNSAIDDEDFAIGPSYFMKGLDLERVWKRSLMPLLIERYWGARSRDEVEATFGLNAIRKQIADAADQPIESDGD